MELLIVKAKTQPLKVMNNLEFLKIAHTNCQNLAYPRQIVREGVSLIFDGAFGDKNSKNWGGIKASHKIEWSEMMTNRIMNLHRCYMANKTGS